MNPPPLYRIRRRHIFGRLVWAILRCTGAQTPGQLAYHVVTAYPTHAEALADVVGRIERSRA